MRRFSLLWMLALGGCYPFLSAQEHQGNMADNEPKTWYADGDGDGFGWWKDQTQAVEQPEGFVLDGTDCDDEDPTENPDVTWYADEDSDEHGNPDKSNACERTDDHAWVLDSGDCNDADPTVYSGAPGLCDGQANDCTSLENNEQDDDGDGYVSCNIDGGGWDGVAVVGGGDCDDTDPTVHPSAAGRCDGLANDCIALEADEGDDDGDGYVACTFDADGWDGDPSIVSDGDCDDGDSTVYPLAPGLCDGLANDCVALEAEEEDGDGDGYVLCTIDVGGWDGSLTVVGGDDCDDTEPARYPAADEVCDDLDNDCNTLVDEDDPGLIFLMWYADQDGDGRGDGIGIEQCDAPGANYANYDGDCDDMDPTVYPGRIEELNGLDGDCDGIPDSSNALDAPRISTALLSYQLGRMVASGGDLDGDGLDDVLAGGPNLSSHYASLLLGGGILPAPGNAYVFHGSGDVSRMVGSLLFGTSIAGGRDVDGDGTPEILVGAPQGFGEVGGGRAYLIYGSNTFTGLDDVNTLNHVELTSVYEMVGASVALIGDLDGDLGAEVVVGANEGDGTTYLVYSSALTPGVPFDLSNAERFIGIGGSGAALANVEDVDGDGLDDLMVGSPDSPGTAHLIYGDPSLVGVIDMDVAGLAISGGANEDALGTSVGGGGDVNGDGYADLLIGDPTNPDPNDPYGKAWIVYGGAALPQAMPVADSDVTLTNVNPIQIGTSVANVWDVDSDGRDDVLIGAEGPVAYVVTPGFGPLSTGAGRAYLLSGADALPGTHALANVAVVIVGSGTTDLGRSVSAAGDVNGDDIADLVIGAPSYGTVPVLGMPTTGGGLFTYYGH